MVTISGRSGLLFFSEWRVETAAVKLIIVFSVAGENSPTLPRSIYFYPILVPWVPEYLQAYLPVFLLHIYCRWSNIVLYCYCITVKQAALYHNSGDRSDQGWWRCWLYKQILYVNIRGKNKK